MQFVEWKKNNNDKELQRLVIGAEFFLNSSGMLSLKNFLSGAESCMLVIDENHPQCHEILKEVAFIPRIISCTSDEVATVIDVTKPSKILSGYKKNYNEQVGIALDSLGCQVEYFNNSASSYVDVIPKGMKEFIYKLAAMYSYEQIIKKIESFKKLKILVVGEAIIDEYTFCKTMNKSNKEPILAAQFQYSEKYAGGVLAVANHIAGFCDNVELLTCLGEINSHEDFVEEKLRDNINVEFLTRSDSPTILKQRIVEEHLARKMLEVYYINNDPVKESEDDAFVEKLSAMVEDADLVVVTDYGHGLFTEKAVDVLCEKAKFLAVNTQTNAGNRGFNLVSKYKRADFISIDLPEAHLECRNRNLPEEELIRMIAKKTNCPRVTITMGKRGNIYLCDDVLYKIPVLSLKLIDAIGAGDAFLSIASCAAAVGFAPELTGFVGNVAGAEACTIIGNKSSVTFSGMKKHISDMWDMAGVEK